MSEFKLEIEETPAVSHHKIWAEKYRPCKLEDFMGSDTIKEFLKLWIEKKDIGQLFFWGPPGVGKTSLAKIIISHIPCDSLFLNASDENSVEIMRNKVQDFAMTIGCNPLKVIVLDEFDRVSFEAQCILRNLSETYSEFTRFILTANYQEKVIPAIKSRFQSFEIKPLSKPGVMKYLTRILSSENIIFDLKDVVFIINSYFPDIRKIINFSQQSSISGTLKIEKENAADQDYKNKLVELLKTPNKAGVFTEIRQTVSDASFSNYDTLYRYLFDNVDNYSKSKVADVILILADASYQSALVVEREITFIAAMHKILSVLNTR